MIGFVVGNARDSSLASLAQNDTIDYLRRLRRGRGLIALGGRNGPPWFGGQATLQAHLFQRTGNIGQVIFGILGKGAEEFIDGAEHFAGAKARLHDIERSA